MTDAFPSIEPLGADGLLVRFADRLDDRANRACVAFRAALEEAALPGVTETASSLGSVLVLVGEGLVRVEGRLRDLLALRDWAEVPLPTRRLWRVPTSYGGEDGPQLAEAADLAGMAPATAIEALSGARVRVLALGFAPGMPYLGILPAEWDVPRRTGLTPRVPEGALVTAVRQFVLFGTEAPTGWRQVGRTLFGCFEPGRARPIALSPGDEVIFPSVSAKALRTVAAADPDRHGGATWEALA